MIRKFLIVLFLLSIISGKTFSQFDEILKKLPGINDIVRKSSISTTLDDIYPIAPWMDDYDKYVNDYVTAKNFGEVKNGYYRLDLKSFCLKAGGWGPSPGGKGYLLAPIKGLRAEIVTKIIDKYNLHPEIDQKDVQVLLWSIEAGHKFEEFPPDFQLRVMPLLTAEDVALLEVSPYDINMVLPDELKEVFAVYEQLRTKMKDANTTYEQIENVAVRFGEPPLDKNEKQVQPGLWTLTKKGYYVRTYPLHYTRTIVEVYKPADVEVKTDDKGRITSLQIPEAQITAEYYDENSISIKGKSQPINRFKSIKFYEFGKLTKELENKGWYIPSDKKNLNKPSSIDSDPDVSAYEKMNSSIHSFEKEIKKYGKTKKISMNSQVMNTAISLKSFEIAVKEAFGELPVEDKLWAYSLTIDATNNKIGNLFKGKGSGGETEDGFSMEGLLSMPPNTVNQRIGISSNPTENENEENGNVHRRRRNSGETEETNNSEGNLENEGNIENNNEEEHNHIPYFIIHQVDRNILPEPNISFNATVLGRNTEDIRITEIDYTIFDISNDKGTCLNDRTPGTMNNEPDFAVLQDENPSLEISSGDVNSIQVTDRDGSTFGTGINIHCLDYGAWAKVKASISYTDRRGQQHTSDAVADMVESKTYITLPQDLNENRIADKWEEDNHVAGRPPESDEETSPGNSHTGDGITLFEEYRGFMVTEADLTQHHVRLDPSKKEMFVVDDWGLFGSAIITWERASGITPYILTLDQINGSEGGTETDAAYRLVDFNRGYAGGSKYAVLMKRADGHTDPYPLEGHSQTAFGYSGNSEFNSPLNSKHVVIFPDRIRDAMFSAGDTVSMLLVANPSRTRFTFSSGTYTRRFLNRFVELINIPAVFAQLVSYITTFTVVHETGHACGLTHHNAAGNEFSGDDNCPMKYIGTLQNFSFMLAYLQRGVLRDLEEAPPGTYFVITYSGWRFCTAPDNCKSKLNVNDTRP